MRKTYIFIVMTFVFLAGHSQYEEGTVAFNIPDNSNFSSLALLTWENDFWLRTDYYFTNGVALELVGNRYAIKRLTNFLHSPLTLNNKSYSISIRQNMYTPEKMYAPDIQLTDRPYAGYLTVEYKVISENSNRRFSSSLMVGVLGKHSLAGATQDFVHSMDHLERPEGWQYQVNDAPVINLSYTHEHKFLSSPYFDARYTLIGRLGSLYTDASASLCFRVGKRHSGFDLIYLNTPPGDFEFYFFGQAGAKLSYYNATLQGSILLYTPSNHYFTNDQREMLVSNLSGGFVFGYNRYRLRVSLTAISPEFIGGKTHSWGEITLGIAF